MAITPTAEQAAALEVFGSGMSMALDALAGTGKTSTLKMLAESAPNRRGQYLAFNKALRADQPVATPDGWREIGTLAVGDAVFGPEGEPHAVTKVIDLGERPMRTVRFSDGTTVVADVDHLWTVDRTHTGNTTYVITETVTTAEVEAHLAARRSVRVPQQRALHLPKTDLLVDPWLLGVLLGDGSLGYGKAWITNLDDWTFAEVERRLPAGCSLRFVSTPGRRARTAAIVGDGRTNPLMERLRLIGVYGLVASTKCVPDEYLWASVGQRLALLRGLMDTDGSVGALRVTPIFTSTSEALADAVVFLTQSLGGTATKRVMREATEKWARAWQVTVRLPLGVIPFALPGKAAALRTRTHDRRLHRQIVAVEPAASAPAVCISIDSPDHLFLTAGLVPTHNSIVTEAAAKFPSNVSCKTAHGLAFATQGRRFGARLKSRRLRGDEMARILGVDPYVVTYGSQRKVLQPGYLAGHVIKAIGRFCQSADPEPTRDHFSYIDGIDLPNPDGSRTHENNDRIRDALEGHLATAWADLSDPAGHLRFSHDVYLKLFALAGTQIGCDFLLVDEAQDLSPVMLQIVEAQRGCQIVLVGDANQSIYCQPAGTMVRVAESVGGGRGRGAPTWSHREVPIEEVRAGQRVVSWTGTSWRLGVVRRAGCRVESVTVKDYDGPLVRVTTASGATSAYTPDHHCVTMLGDACRGEWVTYMMRKGDQYRVGCCLGRYESQGGRFGPLLRAGQEGGDAVWVLGRYADKATARGAEAALIDIVSGRCFKSAGGGAWWDEQSSNRSEAAGVLVGYGLSIDAPLIEVGPAMLTSTRTPLVTQARNLLDGMRVLPAGNAIEKGCSDAVGIGSWEPIKVTSERYVGPIYSLSVERDHTYVADGIVTHNSWRGSINAMERSKVDARAVLTRSFRFGPAVADVANWCLGHLGTELRVEGSPAVPSVVERLADPGAVLTRTNAGAMEVLFDEVDRGHRVCLLGGGTEIASFARAARELMQTGGTQHPELACFSSWNEVKTYVEQDPAGDELALLVRLIDDYGVDAILSALDGQTPESAADVVVSTAHKAKGREWDHVQLHSDFRDPADSLGDTREEWRLLYVAVTRAKLTLDPFVCPAFHRYLNPDAARPEQRQTVPAPVSAPVPAGYAGDVVTRRPMEVGR